MTEALREFTDQYSRSLEAYLREQNEEALQRAYELGRSAIAMQIGVLDIVWAHQEVLSRVLRSVGIQENPAQTAILSSHFLSESLAPVEMTQRGFQEAITALSQRAVELAESNRRLETEITERKRWEEALKQSEALFRSLFENSTDLITILNKDGTVRSESPSVERVLGYKTGDLLGKNIFEYVHPDDVDELIRIFRAGIQIPQYTVSKVFRVRRKDDTWRIMESVGKNLLDVPGVEGVLVTSRDITDNVQLQQQLTEESRRRTEDARRFAVSVQRAQEEERQRIARELHDDICQRLSALRLTVNLFEDDSPVTDPNMRIGLRNIKHRLDGMITDVRRMSTHLRPMALDLFGLATALRILCEEVGKAHSTHVTFQALLHSDEHYDAQTEIALYRIAQEALNNAAKHAYAKSVGLCLARSDGRITLTIKDDGKGFVTNGQTTANSLRAGSGLTNMRERAELLGGDFRIDSALEKGTTIHVALPLTTP